jgi:transposase
MARPQKKFNEEDKLKIINAYKNSKHVKEQKRLQCLKLRVEKNMPGEQISEIVGYSVANIDKIIAKFREKGLDAILWKKKAGNHRYLTKEQEADVLKPFIEKAEKGQMLIVSDIKNAYEKEVKKGVSSSTIYRLLKRHKWRKIMPRSKHPKSKPEEQEAYKKNQ